MGRIPLLAGRKCSIAWVSSDSGRFPGKDYYDDLDDRDRAKFDALLERLGRDGFIENDTRFHKEKNSEIYVAKAGKRRLFLFPHEGSWLIVAGFTKKSNKDKKLERAIVRAERVRSEHLNSETRE